MAAAPKFKPEYACTRASKLAMRPEDVQDIVSSRVFYPNAPDPTSTSPRIHILKSAIAELGPDVLKHTVM
eukprot:12211244-Alexandrium_andersonii.AAC.1